MKELDALLGSLVALVATIAVLAAVGLAVSQAVRRLAPRPDRLGGSLRFLALTGPVWGTLVWTAGASLHELEPGSCLGHPGHHPGDLRVHVGLLVISVVAPLAAALFHHLARNRRLGGRHQPLAADHPATARIAAILASDPRLSRLRVRVLDDDSAALLRTDGWLRPRVEIGARLARTLPEPDLRAALYHEREHVRAYDPLRRLVLAVAVSLNPLARWVRPEADLWRFGRELACDRSAVAEGADPLGLAAALVAVARPGEATLCPALARGPVERLQVRVRLLLAYATRRPGRAATPSAWILLAGVALLLAVPHAVDAWPLVGLYHDIHDGLFLP